MGIQHWWNDIDRGKPKCWEKKTCPSVTLSTTNITLTALGSNQGLCYEKVVTNCLSHSVPFEAQGHQINAKNSVPTSQETSQPPKTNQSMQFITYSLFTVTIICNIFRQFVGTMQSFVLLKNVVNIVTTMLQSVAFGSHVIYLNLAHYMLPGVHYKLCCRIEEGPQFI